MKFLVVFACAIAAVSAGYIAPVAPIYAGAQHLPTINQEGVPVDTAAVQHATAAHLDHKVNVAARNGDLAVAPVVAHHPAHHVVAPVAAVAHPAYPTTVAHPAVVAHPAYPTTVAHPAVVAHPAHHAYPTTAVAPATVNGVPLDTPEVAAAKIHHFAAHAEALARYRRGIYAPGVLAYGAYPYSHSYGFPYGYAHHY